MSIRWKHLTTATLVVAAMAMMASSAWAIYYALGPSKDEWGMKYDVQTSEVDSDNVNFTFTLIDEGRLKPIYKIELIAFSKQLDPQGGRSYDVLVPLKFEVKDGVRVAQVKMKKEFADRAHFRVLTQMVDGKRQPSGGSYHNIFVAKYMGDVPNPPAIATPKSPKFNR